jgi:hypothetical protein
MDASPMSLPIEASLFDFSLYGQVLFTCALLMCVPMIGVLWRRDKYPINKRPIIAVWLRALGVCSLAVVSIIRSLVLPCFVMVSSVACFRAGGLPNNDRFSHRSNHRFYDF